MKSIKKVIKRIYNFKIYNQYKSNICSMSKTNFEIKFNQLNCYKVIKERKENNHNIDNILKKYYFFFEISKVEKFLIEKDLYRKRL